MTTNAAPKLTAPRVRKASKPAEVKAEVKADDGLKNYANAGVAIMSALSALLNGYANAEHAEIAWAGWGMGLTIPVIILIIGKVASLLYKRGQHRAAYITGAVGCGLLLLSVWHCSISIAALTGSPLLLAAPMATAIDLGFVCCEVAAMLD